MAGDIERQAEAIDVTVALGANEAMLVLEERDDIDCIVSDYRMPQVDGLQLLERVRGDDRDLPFVLVTSAGSEDVAASAIDADVTDYLVKEPGTDQTSTFVDKIRSAVAQYRLRQAIEESEDRYRTVIEQSRDAIAILQDGVLVFCNQRTVALTGRDREALRSGDVLGSIVYPEDQDRIRSVVERWLDSTEQHPLHETRIVRPDGEVRHCEVTGRSITYDGEPALLLSIRDVTERKRRERELAWERELNRNVQEALVESRTREDLEGAIVEQLRAQGYALVWIAEQIDGTLTPRVVETDQEYVEQVDRSASGGHSDSEPCVWAARTGEPQFVGDFESLFATAWRDAALAAGYRGGAGLPLVYNDVSYGVLAVYHDRPDQFDAAERRLLCELADTVAFAIHSLETESALASDHVVEVSLAVDGDRYYLAPLACDGAFVDCDRVCVRGTVPHGEDAVIQYVTVEGGSIPELRDTLADHPDVREVLVIADDGPGRLQVTVTGPVPEAHLASRGVVVQSTTVEADGVTIDAELPAKEDVRSAVETLEESFGPVSVRSVVERERDGRGDAVSTADLTEKQATALEAAYHHGYFEQPRQSSATDVAESLGVAHSTFLQHLRTAQQKLFERRFE